MKCNAEKNMGHNKQPSNTCAINSMEKAAAEEKMGQGKKGLRINKKVSGPGEISCKCPLFLMEFYMIKQKLKRLAKTYTICNEAFSEAAWFCELYQTPSKCC